MAKATQKGEEQREQQRAMQANVVFFPPQASFQGSFKQGRSDVYMQAPTRPQEDSGTADSSKRRRRMLGRAKSYSLAASEQRPRRFASMRACVYMHVCLRMYVYVRACVCVCVSVVKRSQEARERENKNVETERLAEKGYLCHRKSTERSATKKSRHTSAITVEYERRRERERERQRRKSERKSRKKKRRRTCFHRRQRKRSSFFGSTSDL